MDRRRLTPRTRGSERSLASRIAHERGRRNLTYEALSRQMGQVGCKIDKSSLQKIEVADAATGKFRRVTVNELIGFSNVFDLSLDELLEPFARVRDREARELVEIWAESRDSLGAIQERMNVSWSVLKSYLHV